MTTSPTSAPSDQAPPTWDEHTLAPLTGEPGIPNIARRATVSVSRKGLAAVALLVLSLAAVSTLSIEHYLGSRRPSGDIDAKRAGDRPAASTFEPKRLDMTLPAPAIGVSAPASVRIPALVPTPEELDDAIAVRRAGTASSTPTAKTSRPEDAPAVLISSRPEPVTSGRNDRLSADAPAGRGDDLNQTRRNLDNYQRQLQGLLGTLAQTTSVATSGDGSAGRSVGTTPLPASPGGGQAGTSTGASSGLLGGQLPESATPRVDARLLANRSLILTKGTAFTCALKTRVVSATSGLVACQVQRNVYGDDGRVLLIERGSHLDGEYRVVNLRPGTVRIPVLWTRVRTPTGVTVDLDSPGTGPLGESGIDGFVDNRWAERVGAALMLSVIDDSVNLLIRADGNAPPGNNVLLPSTSSNTSKLAEKVLDSTINIPPLIYQNQGEIVGIVVARDVNFSSVYELRPVAR